MAITNNMARYSNGVWSPVGTSLQELLVLSVAVSGSNLYYVLNDYPAPGEPLPIGGINIETNESVLVDIPTVSLYGFVNTVYAVGNVIYFGGEFQAELISGDVVSNGLLPLFFYLFRF